MSIGSIGTSSPLTSLSAMTSGQQRRGGGPIDAAAKALGLSSDDVLSQLQSGKSLGDIADAQGVSRDDLASALKADAPDELKNSGNIDQIVSSMIDQTGGPQGGPPPPPSGGFGPIDSTASGVLGSSLTDSQQSTLDALASLLGTDSDALLDDLQSGTSLSDLLSGSGTSASDLAGILQDGLLFDAKA